MNPTQAVTSKTMVYILSDHEENGAENIRATLDPAKLEALYAEYGEPTEAELSRLRAAIAKNAAGHFWLDKGWGGVGLDVVELA